MKRFYRTAAVGEAGKGRWDVRLDDRPVRTPARALLVLPSRPLAEIIAAEWDAQRETVEPARMPTMQLAATAIDRVAPGPEAVIEGVLRYAETDLVCYRAERPQSLAARQHAAWQPLLDWVTQAHDAPLLVTRGILAVEQPPSSLAALKRAVAALDPMRLSALQIAVAACGSLVIALALVGRRIGAAEAFEAALVDELHQAETWGEDPEAVARREALLTELMAVERALHALGEDAP